MSLIIFVLYGHGPILNYKDNNLITKLLTCRDNKDLLSVCQFYLVVDQKLPDKKVADGEKSFPTERNHETGTNPFLPQNLSPARQNLRLAVHSGIFDRSSPTTSADPWRNNLCKDR